MKPVYQRINDPKRGDCFKCAICSLLELDYDSVPNFVELGEKWFKEAMNVFYEHGYELGAKTLWNPNVHYLEDPTTTCWTKRVLCPSMSLDAITPDDGINGLFLASVYSPKYTNANEHPINHLHSVLCDINFRIVFDPQEDYMHIISYPYAKLIDYNGIRAIETIRKIK